MALSSKIFFKNVPQMLHDGDLAFPLLVNFQQFSALTEAL